MKIVLALLVLLVSGYAFAQEIEWNKDLDASIVSAKQSGRPIVVDFWADWCEPCKVMEERLWKTPDGRSLASKFIFVRLDFDKATPAVRKYHVVSVPTVVITDPWGNQLSRVSGFSGPAPYIRSMKSIPANLKPLDAVNDVLSKDGKNVDALRSAARFYYEAGAYEVSNSFYDRASGHARTSADRAEMMVSMGWNHLKLKDYISAEAVFQECLQNKELVSRDVALFGMVVSTLGQKKKKEAEKALQDLISLYPDSPATNQARRLMQSNP